MKKQLLYGIGLLLAGCQMDSTVEELFTLPRLPTEYTT